MKILFLPENIASMPALTAAALNKNNNVQAKCLTINVSKYQDLGEEVVVLPKAISKRKPLKWLLHKLTFKKKIKRLIDWADILHYTWGTALEGGSDLKYARKKNKKIFIEWVGSDIRNPDYLRSINPFYQNIFENGYEYAHFESYEQSQKNQQLFAKYNAVPLVCAEMQLYIDRHLFSNSSLPILYQRVDVHNFKPVYPSPANKRPLIVHSPSAKIAKGTNVILSVIDLLKKSYEFDFVLLHDISRQEVIEKMQQADIFLDQIILGSYGMAAMEAMSLGKPVMCYIMKEVFAAGLSDECPIVNTHPDNLKEQLVELITNANLRHETGKKSRAFAEKFHSVKIIGDQLLDIYKTDWV